MWIADDLLLGEETQKLSSPAISMGVKKSSACDSEGKPVLIDSNLVAHLPEWLACPSGITHCGCLSMVGAPIEGATIASMSAAASITLPVGTLCSNPGRRLQGTHQAPPSSFSALGCSSSDVTSSVTTYESNMHEATEENSTSLSTPVSVRLWSFPDVERVVWCVVSCLGVAVVWGGVWSARCGGFGVVSCCGFLVCGMRVWGDVW